MKRRREARGWGGGRVGEEGDGNGPCIDWIRERDGTTELVEPRAHLQYVLWWCLFCVASGLGSARACVRVSVSERECAGAALRLHGERERFGFRWLGQS